MSSHQSSLLASSRASLYLGFGVQKSLHLGGSGRGRATSQVIEDRQARVPHPSRTEPEQLPGPTETASCRASNSSAHQEETYVGIDVAKAQRCHPSSRRQMASRGRDQAAGLPAEDPGTAWCCWRLRALELPLPRGGAGGLVSARCAPGPPKLAKTDLWTSGPPTSGRLCALWPETQALNLWPPAGTSRCPCCRRRPPEFRHRRRASPHAHIAWPTCEGSCRLSARAPFGERRTTCCAGSRSRGTSLYDLLAYLPELGTLDRRQRRPRLPSTGSGLRGKRTVGRPDRRLVHGSVGSQPPQL